MKIIYDASPIIYPLTGIGRFAFELGSILTKEVSLEDLRLFARSSFIHALPGPNSSPQLGKTASIPRKAKQWVKKSKTLTAAYLAGNEYATGLRLRRYGDHIFHGTNYYLPLFSGRKIATIYDLSTLLHPQYHPADRVRIVNNHIEKACRRADRIVTLSHYIRQEIITTLSLPQDKVVVTSPGISPDFRPRSFEALAPVLSQLRLYPGRYCLYVGTMDPRKNITLILDTYRGLPDRVRKTHPLIICGDKGWESTAFHAKLQEGINNGWVRVMGYVPNEMLLTIMAGATLFLYPSYYEGFGFPPLESMRCGVPVIASNRASLPEVVGTAALTLDPNDVDAWRTAIIRYVEDETFRNASIKKGLERAAAFTWENCLKQTLAIYSTLE